jgi:hypothetical protein
MNNTSGSNVTELQREVEGYKTKLTDLALRAKKTNYKNRIPRLPKNTTSSTMMGFRKRFNNWVRGLKTLERERLPHGILQDKELLNNYYYVSK